MPDCTFTEEEQDAIDGAAKWSQFEQSELLAIQLATLIDSSGFEVGTGCDFSEDEQALIDASQKWLSYSQSELIALMLAALNP